METVMAPNIMVSKSLNPLSRNVWIHPHRSSKRGGWTGDQEGNKEATAAALVKVC